MAGNIFAKAYPENCPVESQLITVAVAFEVRFKPFQIIAGLQVDDAVAVIVEVHSDLARLFCIFSSDRTFGKSGGEQFCREGMTQNRFLQFRDEAEILTGDDITVKTACPFRIRLGAAPIGIAGFRIYRPFGNQELTVKFLLALQNQSVSCSADGECRRFGLFNFPLHLFEVELGTGAEIAEQMTAEKFPGF